MRKQLFLCFVFILHMDGLVSKSTFFSIFYSSLQANNFFMMIFYKPVKDNSACRPLKPSLCQIYAHSIRAGAFFLEAWGKQRSLPNRDKQGLAKSLCTFVIPSKCQFCVGWCNSYVQLLEQAVTLTLQNIVVFGLQTFVWKM